MSKKKQKTTEELARQLDLLQQQYELDVVDKQILKLMSIDPLLTCREIAKAVGMHYATISKRMAKPGFKRAMDAVTETTAQILERNARKAAQRINALIGDSDKKIALDACKLSLAPLLNNHNHNVTVANQITYRTTVQPDSSLLQEIIEGELTEEK